MHAGLTVAPVNTGLTVVYEDDRLIGSVRKGLDGKWYPELPPTIGHEQALRDLVRAHRCLQGCDER